MQYTIKDNRISFLVNQNIYKKQTIMQVAYQFIDGYYVYLDVAEEEADYIKVVLEPKPEVMKVAKDAAGEFLNELLNQNLREAVEEKTKEVRELVLARALFHSYLDAKPETGDETLEEYHIDTIAKDWFDEHVE